MSGGTLGRSVIIVLERAYFKITCIYRKNRLRHRQRCGSGGIIGQFLLQRGGADGFGIEQALPAFGSVEDQRDLAVDDPVNDVRLPLGHLVDALNRRSEEHTSELQSLMRISYAVFCLTKQTKTTIKRT